MKNRQIISTIAVLLLVPFMLSAQENYRISSNNSSIVIKGTSSLHDWEMDASNLAGSISIALNEGAVSQISDGTVKLKSKDIKSHNSIMDGKAWDALKSDDYPEIVFHLTHVDLKPEAGGKFSGRVYGKLQLAGITRDINTTFTGESPAKDRLKINGTFKLDMLNYKIDPPTAMMGALKTGNQVELTFDLDFQQNTSITYLNH
ncbi:MAG: YceI family protein [Bacteroidota bacterium]